MLVICTNINPLRHELITLSFYFKGPLLFIIYINDIPEISYIAKFFLYADVANIIVTANT